MFETTPTFDKVYDLLQETGGNFIPVYQDVPSDLLTPVTAYLKLAHGSKYSFLLESAYAGETISRYSFIGANPYKVTKSGPNEDIKGDPLVPLEQELKSVRYVQVPGLPRGTATGGAFGYISYDCVQHFEPRTACDVPDPIGVPESIFLYCDTVVAFDHVYKLLKVITHIRVPEDASRDAVAELYEAATKTIQTTIDVLYADAIPFPEQPPIDMSHDISSNTGAEGYMAMVRGLKEHIVKGDIIQAVPAQRITRPTSLHPFNAYRYLRTVNPAPYMFYFDFDGFQAVGASPEMLARVHQGQVFNHPIAGTRKRGATAEEDDRLAAELLADEKERAEHVMLVDLGRNDLNRVCKPESVKADKLMEVERFSHVMHIVSNLSGELREDKSGFDAFRSILPAGTLSGAPKVRAVQLIYEAEKECRGIYGGALGHFNYSGDLDTCIGIRTMVFKDGNAYIQVGAGVVHDSVPESEWQETMNKAMSNLTTINEAEKYHHRLQQAERK
ncbi:anthranilate synthase component 1 [Coemansia sp. RSA 1822]|nr:anthranilate synthase component 1 [Coemansia sp. RSA 638]KAJ2543257.1 anthranilate synthase component 1 [Coemansia sp. RSA 1853]KAJ2563765.1 anthranilate synthase component 1 [Coemansia sp. RSA 1822]